MNKVVRIFKISEILRFIFFKFPGCFYKKYRAQLQETGKIHVEQVATYSDLVETSYGQQIETVNRER